jgi:hypothetical protein
MRLINGNTSQEGMRPATSPANSHFPPPAKVTGKKTVKEATNKDIATRVNKTIRETSAKTGNKTFSTAVPWWARNAMDLLTDEYKQNYGKEPTYTWKGVAQTPKPQNRYNNIGPSMHHVVPTTQGGPNSVANSAIINLSDNSRIGGGQSPHDFYNRDLTNPAIAGGYAAGVYKWFGGDKKRVDQFYAGAGRDAQGIIDYAAKHFISPDVRKQFVTNMTAYKQLLNTTMTGNPENAHLANSEFADSVDRKLTAEDYAVVHQRTIADIFSNPNTHFNSGIIPDNLKNKYSFSSDNSLTNENISKLADSVLGKGRKVLGALSGPSAADVLNYKWFNEPININTDFMTPNPAGAGAKSGTFTGRNWFNLIAEEK